MKDLYVGQNNEAVKLLDSSRCCATLPTKVQNNSEPRETVHDFMSKSAARREKRTMNS